MRSVLREPGRAASIRQAAHLSQAEVAASIGATSTAVSAWETGRRNPRGEHAKKYADALHGMASGGLR